MLQQSIGSTVRRSQKTIWSTQQRKIIPLRVNFHSTMTETNQQTSSSTKSPTKEEEKKKKTMTYVPSPSPPALEPKEQREFISLLRKSNQPSSSSSHDGKVTTTTTTHPDLVDTKGPVEFEGDVNPATGEVNGPKRDPLRWPNEWGYGGRATDF